MPSEEGETNFFDWPDEITDGIYEETPDAIPNMPTRCKGWEERIKPILLETKRLYKKDSHKSVWTLLFGIDGLSFDIVIEKQHSIRWALQRVEAFRFEIEISCIHKGAEHPDTPPCDIGDLVGRSMSDIKYALENRGEKMHSVRGIMKVSWPDKGNKDEPAFPDSPHGVALARALEDNLVPIERLEMPGCAKMEIHKHRQPTSDGGNDKLWADWLRNRGWQACVDADEWLEPGVGSGMWPSCGCDS